MTPGPNIACVLVISGVLAIYAEGLWPGRIAPGVLGSAALIAGACSLYRLSPTVPGLAFIAGAAALFAAEARWDSFFVCGICATAALTAGFWLLLGPPHRISPPCAIIASVILGIVTVVLSAAAKRARRNKRSDIS